MIILADRPKRSGGRATARGVRQQRRVSWSLGREPRTTLQRRAVAL